MTHTPDAQLESTLPGRLALWAKREPSSPALRHKKLGIWEEIDWARYYQEVSYTARALGDMGLSPDGHVGILCDNRPEWLYADLGAQALGARSVGIYATSPGPDVAYILNHSQCSVLVCEDQEQVDKFMEVRNELQTVEHVIVVEPRGTRGYDEPRLVSWEDFRKRGESLVSHEPQWMEQKLRALDPNAASMVVYTSGTTGKPKGAMISSANVIEVAEATRDAFGVTGEELVLSYLPLCHVAEKIYSVFLPLTSGAVVHFGESIDTVQEDLREVSPTIYLGVPRIWEKMHASLMIKMQNSSWLKRTLFDFFTQKGMALYRKRHNGGLALQDQMLLWLGDLLVFRPLQERLGLRRCRIPSSGAAPIAPELVEWYHGVGLPVCEAFGMTECAGATHLNRPDNFRIGTVGQAIGPIEARIAADGELLIKGPCVFLGYLHNEEATREVIDEQGWLHTGDIAEIDGDGYLKITGRKKEIIITAGGKNLSPEKIENALKTSPFIKEAVAIGDARKFVSALVQIEYDTVGDWAQRRSIAYTSYADLADKPDVVKLVEEEIARANELLARVESVRGFRILPKELHEDDGELTATQKVRRKVVARTYEPLIRQMYGG